MTPTETLIDVLSKDNIDTVRAVVIIYRTSDGIIGYRTDDSQEFADTFGLLKFATLSMENDLKKSWNEES